MKDYVCFAGDELQALDHFKTLIILPVGSTEQHGPHLPVATDSLTAEYLAGLVAEKADGFPVLVAPSFRYTYAKPSMVFPGTITVEGETLVKLTRDALRSFLVQGFRRMMVLNAHMENTDFLIEGISLALEPYQSSKVFLCNWWELLPDETVREIFGPDWKGWVDEHAAVVETSIMLYIAPDLVRMNKAVDGQRRSKFEFRIFPWDAARFPESGVFSETRGAAAEKGRRLLELLADETLRVIQREFSDFP
jgi:creatinine amidohydrolase